MKLKCFITICLLGSTESWILLQGLALTQTDIKFCFNSTDPAILCDRTASLKNNV